MCDQRRSLLTSRGRSPYVVGSTDSPVPTFKERWGALLERLLTGDLGAWASSTQALIQPTGGGTETGIFDMPYIVIHRRAVFTTPTNACTDFRSLFSGSVSPMNIRKPPNTTA